MKNLFFEKQKNRIFYDGQYTYENESCVLVYEGEVYYENEILTAEELCSYLLGGGRVESLDGLFCLVMYEKETERLFATQDAFSYFHPLYFAETEGGLVLSLGMRELIKKANITPKINDSYIPEFLYNGFLTDDRCLISGIRKLPALHNLKWDFLSGEWNYVKKRQFRETGLGGDYCELLSCQIEKELCNTDEINMALSSGFDSNLILHIITSLKPKCKINCFCIGSQVGSDETEAVKAICKEYPNVNLTVQKVTPDILKSFPKMVCELEDSVFERGIFLQYMLSEAMVDYKENPTFFGEGADQLLSSQLRFYADPYYYVGIEQHYPWVYFPYEMLTYIILKKNGIFLRNRDIKAKYPFISAKFILGVSAYRELNGTDKKHYKDYILNLVSPTVAERLVKQPGSTNLSSLFDESNKEKLFRAAKTSRFYPMLTGQPDRDSGSEVEMDNCLKIIYLMLFEKIFCSCEPSLSEDSVCSVRMEDILD